MLCSVFLSVNDMITQIIDHGNLVLMEPDRNRAKVIIRLDLKKKKKDTVEHQLVSCGCEMNLG